MPRLSREVGVESLGVTPRIGEIFGGWEGVFSLMLLTGALLVGIYLRELDYALLARVLCFGFLGEDDRTWGGHF